MLNLKSLLKVLPIVLLSFGPIVGMGGVARSQVSTVPVPQLIRDLSPSPEEVKMLNAARDSIPDLIQLLTHQNTSVQDGAASALANKGELALSSIIPLLKHDDRLLRSKAAYILGVMGESRVFRYNKNLIRETVLGIMGESGGIRHDTTVIQESVQSMIPMLVVLLKDQDGDVRSNAVYALGQIGESAKSAVPDLIPLLQDQNRWVQMRASYALAQMGEAAKSALISRLKDPDEMIRVESAQVLGEMGERDTKTIPTLLLLLKSQRPEVRSAAISSLGIILNFSDTSAMASSIMPSLIAMLDDPNAEVQARAATTLGSIGEPAKSAVPKLIPLLKHPDRATRLFAAYALGEMGKSAQSAIPKLIPLLKDADPDVRSSATDALIELGYLKGERRTPRLARPVQPIQPMLIRIKDK
jgi:HEAT repeat protein